MSAQEFAAKVVLVTGASSGIGASIAIQFSQLGASVAITGRNLENLQKTEQQCKDSPKPLLIVADLTNDNDIKQVVEETIQHFGRLDVLVNNAGIFEGSDIENTTLEQFDNVLNTNVRSIFQLTKLAIPHLIASQGNVVNISSLTGLRAFSGGLPYCVSKAALDQFTQCIALELAPKKVRVNSVNPGVIVTDIFRRSGMTESQVEEYMERQIKVHPLGRVGQPDEVANAVTFLASNRASFITGVLLPVDSGRHASCPR